MNDSRHDLLISRIAEGDAARRDWDELAALAEADPSLWRGLAEAQRDQAELLRVMERASAIADRVGAGAVAEENEARDRAVPIVHVKRRPVEHAPEDPQPYRLVGPWAGWAVAALIMLAWVINGVQVPTSDPAGNGAGQVQQAGFIPVHNAQEAWDAYLSKGREEGRVLSDVPRRVLIDTRPAPTGEGFELIFIQQVMERTVVPKLYRFGGEDERGRPTLELLRLEAGRWGTSNE